MTQEEPKTMTAKDAWIAMANGECVKAGAYVHRINVDFVEFWNGEKWLASDDLGKGPYSIVPDPSKPVESEYNDNRIALLNLSRGDYPLDDVIENLLIYIEKHYQRKEPK